MSCNLPFQWLLSSGTVVVLEAKFRNSSNSLLIFSLLVLPFKRPYSLLWTSVPYVGFLFIPKKGLVPVFVRGVALLVRTSFPTLTVPFTTCLEAVAVYVAFLRLVTVCSLYLPDSVPLRVS